MPHLKQVHLMANIPVVFMKERKTFVAYSPAMDLSTSGRTLADAKRKFAEALDLFLEELLEHGTLEQALSELGWHKENEEWQPPIEITKVASIPFKVPAVV